MTDVITEKDRSTDMAKHNETVASTPDDMAVESEEKDMPLGKAVRRYPKIAGYACFVTIAILLWGYDLVIVGQVASIPSFQ